MLTPAVRYQATINIAVINEYLIGCPITPWPNQSGERGELGTFLARGR